MFLYIGYLVYLHFPPLHKRERGAKQNGYLKEIDEKCDSTYRIIYKLLPFDATVLQCSYFEGNQIMNYL
jgi:hypothetical protein